MPQARTSRALDVTFDQSGIGIIESHHADEFRMNPTAHPFWKALFVVAGAGRLLARRREWPLTRSTIVLVPPHVLHRIADDPGNPLSIYVLCIHSAVPFDELRDFEVGQPMQVHNREILSLTSSVMRRLLIERTCMLSGSRLIMTGLAALLFGQMVRAAKIGGPKLKSASSGTRTIVEHYAKNLATAFSEPDDLDSVAQRLGLSRRRLTQLFRQVTGESWLKHVRRLRVEHAKQLLRASGRSIAAVAFECGFEDLSSFYRAFKSTTGQAPHRWRLGRQ